MVDIPPIKIEPHVVSTKVTSVLYLLIVALLVVLYTPYTTNPSRKPFINISLYILAFHLLKLVLFLCKLRH